MKSSALFVLVVACLALVACGGANTHHFDRSSNWRDSRMGDSCRKDRVTQEAYEECLRQVAHSALEALKNNPPAPASDVKGEGTAKQLPVGMLPGNPGVFVPTGSLGKCNQAPDLQVVYTNRFQGHWIEILGGMREAPLECQAFDRMVVIPVVENGVMRMARVIPYNARVVFTKIVEGGGLNTFQVHVKAYVQSRPGIWQEHGWTDQTVHAYCMECREGEPAHWTFHRSDFMASLMSQ